MELKIVNPAGNSYHECVGLSSERRTELIDLMVARVTASTTDSKPKSTMIGDIIGACNTLEEAVYCGLNFSECVVEAASRRLTRGIESLLEALIQRKPEETKEDNL